MGESVLLTADIFSVLYLIPALAGLFISKDKTKSTKALIFVCITSLITCVVDSLCNCVSGFNLPAEIIFLIFFISTTIEPVFMLVFLHYCYDYISEKTVVNKWTFYIPFVVFSAGWLYSLVSVLFSSVFGSSGIGEVLTSGMTYVRDFLYIAFIIYLPVSVVTRINKIGLKSVLVLGLFGFCPLCAKIAAAMGYLDFFYAATAFPVVVVTIFLQNSQISENAKALKTQTIRIQSLANIYHTMHVINLMDYTVDEYKTSDTISHFVNRKLDAITMMRESMTAVTAPEYKQKVLEFTDLTTIADRLLNTNTISQEFFGVFGHWYRARFIVIDRDKNNHPVSVILATMIVQEEHNKEENLIRISKIDELTQLYNRRAYEEALKYYNENKNKAVTVFTLDINGLKNTNDTLGHAAGDELIIGAAKCMTNAFCNFGNLYRVGGDEFVALVQADENELSIIEEKLKDEMSSWRGEKVNHISISFGFVSRKDFPEKTMEQLVNSADERMYEMKKEYYNLNGIERRKMR